MGVDGLKALVSGGGIAGLAAAWALTRAGASVTLVEAAPRLGGKIATEWIDGFLVERGPDAFLTAPPTALALCREVGLGDEIVAPLEPHGVQVWNADRLVLVPEGTGLGVPTRFAPFVTSALFSPREKLRAALEVVLPARSDDEGADESIGSFLRRRFGDAVVDRLAGPLISGIYGAGVDELSLAALMPRLREAERRHGSLIRAGLAARRRALGGGPSLMTLTRGLGSLVEALAAGLSADVRLDVALERIERAGAGYLARLDDGSRLAADVVILATPARATARALAEVSPPATAALATLTYRGTAAISLGYAAGQLGAPLVGHGFVVADGALPIAACTYSSAKWPGRAPAGAVLVRATVRDEALLASSAAELVELAHAAVARVLRISGRPVLARVASWAGAMPRYTVGHLDRLARIETALAVHPLIAIAGAAYRGSGIPDCVAQGEAAAARLLSQARVAA